MDFETIKKLLLLFYSKEDTNFIHLIFEEKDIITFLKELEKFYKSIPDFSNIDPENKFYGIQNFTKLQNNNQEITKIELNKLNTDLIFVLVKKIILSSYNDIDNNNININYMNLIDKISLIKSQIIHIFNCPNISSIGFISNKTENYTSSYPVNFYAFCISIIILLICFPTQIKEFDIGMFDTKQTLFNEKNNQYFYSQLFCSYISFLYLFSKKMKNQIIKLNLHFLDDSNIFENFTFHISNSRYNLIKSILKKVDNFEILNLLNTYFNESINRISFFFHYNINNNIYKDLIEFMNYPGISRKLDIYCDKKIFENKNSHVNLLNDLENCKELNIHIINTNSLIDSYNENEIDLKSEKNIKFQNFSIEGDNIYIDKMPFDFTDVKKLKLISHKKSYYLKDEVDYKNYHKKLLSFNFQNGSFDTLKNIEELTLVYLTPEQYFLFVNSFNNNSDNINDISFIHKLYIQIDYSHLKIQDPNDINNNNNIISKSFILNYIDLLIRNSKRIINIRQLDIILSNDNPKNNLLLTQENAFYFINLVLEFLKKCYHFSLKNFNNYYYPTYDRIPVIKQNQRNQRLNLRKKISENIIDEEFSLQDNVNKCKVIKNLNKDLQVIYDGNDCNDYSKIVDLENALPLLFAVNKKITKLRPKAILINIIKFFNIKIEAPKIFSVCNFNN